MRNKIGLAKKRILIILITIATLSSMFCITSLAGNTIDTATRLYWGSNYYIETTSCIESSYESQYYRVNVTHTGSYTIYLTGNSVYSTAPYTALPADYDLKLYNPRKQQIAVSCASSTTPEYISFEVGGTNPTGYYYIRVYSLSSYVYDEEYRLTITHGDSEMFVEGLRYCNYCLDTWYCRDTYLDTTGMLVTQGVSYSYGNKNSFSYFAAQNQIAHQNALTPFTGWNKYLSYYPYKRPGLFQYEYNSGYSTSNYIGIDCSGFIQRAAMASVDSSGVKNYLISRSLTLTDSGSGSWGSFGNGTYDYSIQTSQLQTGDIAVMSGHVIMISRSCISSYGNSYAMAAESDSNANGGRKVKEYIISASNKYPNSYTGFNYCRLRLS